jgi:hypothetical protein
MTYNEAVMTAVKRLDRILLKSFEKYADQLVADLDPAFEKKMHDFEVALGVYRASIVERIMELCRGIDGRTVH